MSEKLEEEEENSIHFTKEAGEKLLDLCPENPSYRLKVDRTNEGFRNWLHWDDTEAGDDEVFLLEKVKEDKTVKIFIDQETYAFLTAGNTKVDYRKGLLMREFTFENELVGPATVCGEVYKIKS